ncbi:MAG: alpha/beta hydrolase [Blastochloris viridis]|uniref:Alpha/beta hydrolase n=1 Tax=Blastochloris viridis TaxID=1079 RepID=A0A6N4R8T2_BLAVI|nr:MAG: alpha/beta hydrolase [Blastochloris viridis]
MLRTLFLLAATASLLFSATAPHAQTTAPAAASAPSYTADLKDYEYPFPVQTFTIPTQSQNVTMAYMYLPARDGKPTITLLHGKNFNGAYWKKTADFLHAQGYGVLMPDQIGFGKSSKPRNYQYSFAELASNTHLLLKSLGLQKTILVGHSMGGMLATRYALLFPRETEKLILVNPIGLENYLLYQTYPNIDTSYASELTQTPESVIDYQKKFYYDGQWKPAYADLAKPLIGWVNGPDWNELAYISALTTNMILTQPVVEEMSFLTMPTYLILGTRDRTAPGKANQRIMSYELGRYDRLGATTKARNRNIQVTSLKGLGHLPQVEDFPLFSKSLDNALKF